jgi:phosphatidylserine decarboxylase precursor
METHKAVVNQLKTLLDGNAKMKENLLASLQQANQLARNGNPKTTPPTPPLHKNLYLAIDKEFKGKGWPTTIEDYFDYLDQYVVMVPNEDKGTHYAWTSDGTKNGYNQKVYDLLCQFYYLVDQADENGNTMQSYPEFSDWLVSFATAWGTFLDTEDSLTPETLATFEADSMYNMPWYNKNKPTWNTFNKFFYREFNNADPKTGLAPRRPIAAPDDNLTIVSPADCTFTACYPIDDSGNVMAPDGTRLKHTHSIGTVDELLQYSEFSKNFYGGTFIHYFLNPFDYHRFHTPVKGKIVQIMAAVGKVYLAVNVTSDGQFDAPDSSLDGYEFNQSRGIVIVDSESEVGTVAILPIGMAQVSGVDMYTELQGQNVVKGQEFGKFKFGGSDIIMLFEKPPHELYMFQKDPSHNPIHFQYGQTAVYWNK